MQGNAAIDFYVIPHESGSTFTQTWVVRRGSPRSTSHVVVCVSRDEAVQRAIAMAQFQRACGKQSSALIQEKPDSPWQLL